jgi:uncharacterized membrane protein
MKLRWPIVELGLVAVGFAACTAAAPMWHGAEVEGSGLLLLTVAVALLAVILAAAVVVLVLVVACMAVDEERKIRERGG